MKYGNSEEQTRHYVCRAWMAVGFGQQGRTLNMAIYYVLCDMPGLGV